MNQRFWADGIARWLERRGAPKRAALYRKAADMNDQDRRRFFLIAESTPDKLEGFRPLLPEIECGSVSISQPANIMTITIHGEIGSGSILGLPETRLADHDRVVLEIDSEGGCLKSAFGLVSQLMPHKNTLAKIAKAKSAATFVALACQRREIAADGTILLHWPELFCVGNYEDLRQSATSLDSIAPGIVDFVSARTGQPAPTVREWLDTAREFSAQEALAAGLVHAIR